MEELHTLPETDLRALRDLAASAPVDALHARLQKLGITKLGRRLKAIGELQRTAAVGAAAPPAPPQPPPRVAFVCHTGYFTGGFGGATRASLSMLREARRICGAPGGGGGVDIVACVQTPVAEALVYKLEEDRVGELMWEGERVLVGRCDQLARLLSHRTYDVVISFSIEETLLTLALALRATAVRGRRRASAQRAPRATILGANVG
jgi:hypothetical protein